MNSHTRPHSLAGSGAVEVLLDCALVHIQRTGAGRDAGVGNPVCDNRPAQLIAAGLFCELAPGDNTEIPDRAVLLAAIKMFKQVIRLIALDEVQGNEAIEPVGKASDVDERLAFFLT